MNVIYIAIGVVGVAWVLNDIFKQVLVPRAVEGTVRISIIFARAAWRAGRAVARLVRDGSSREDLLGTFAPLYFILLLGVWLAALTLSYGLILYGLRDEIRPEPHDLGTAVYFAATSLLTIGYGDYVATEGAARVVSLFAGASGIGTVAVAITFLYAIIGAFQQRERFVVVLDARAGAPPSGVALIETYAALGIMPAFSTLFRESESWVADVLDSHLAYPILMGFRSSHKDESWVAALGALLDAAALLVTVVECEAAPRGEARLFLDVGMHLTHDLSAYFDLPEVDVAATSLNQRERISARLTATGLKVRTADELWHQFDELRASYVRTLEGIGRRWMHATASLIGERTSLPGHSQ